MVTEQRTALSQFGEFGLISHLTKKFINRNPGTRLGVGDDAAIIDPTKGYLTLVTTDLLVEGVHFDLIYTPLKHLGYKAAIVNFSDIFAMNGKPKQMTVSYAVSNRFSVEALEEFYEGLQIACENYGVDLIGGDTSTTMNGMIISVTVVGEVKEEKVVKRLGAKENDLICVSGNLGAAYLGLQVLEREKSIFNENPAIQPDLSGFDYVLERLLRPEARADVIVALEENGIVPTSMIDISDGLASELLHLFADTDFSCTIYEDKLPLDTATITACEHFNLEPIICALNGGEDYELLFTVDINAYNAIKKIPDVTIIGHVSGDRNSNVLVTRGGNVVGIKAQGWNAFPPGNLT